MSKEFKEKLKSINFGVVPGAAQQAAGKYYDSESINDLFGGPEEEARVLDRTQGVGPLKTNWKQRKDGLRESILYKRDRKSGGYEEADISDVTKVLGLPKESSR